MVLLLLQVDSKRRRVSVDEIETKLKEAALRRQQFHAWVASKAKSRRMTSATQPLSRKTTRLDLALSSGGDGQPGNPNSSASSSAPGHSSGHGSLGASLGSGASQAGTSTSSGPLSSEDMLQRLHTKLEAARKKREAMETEQRRRQEQTTAQRQQAASEARLRLEAKAAELESLRGVREEKAESNRAAILNAEREKRAAVRKRAAKLRARRTEQEWRDNQRALMRLQALGAKLKAAEEKRKQRLAAERERAAALSAQARQVAESVWKEREEELERRREKLEAKVAMARRRRAELLSSRLTGRAGGRRGATLVRPGGGYHRKRLQWEHLSRKLSRCWRAFRGSHKTSAQLAAAYADCAVSCAALKEEGFDGVASRISAPETLSATRALLQRLLLRLSLIPDSDVTAWEKATLSTLNTLTTGTGAGAVAGADIGTGAGTKGAQGQGLVESMRLLPRSNVDHLLTQLMPPAKRAPSRRHPARGPLPSSKPQAPPSALGPKDPSQSTTVSGIALALSGTPAPDGDKSTRAVAPSSSKGAPGAPRDTTGAPQAKAQTSGGAQEGSMSPERYPVRPFLSAYMVVLHPEAVMTSTSGAMAEGVRAAAHRLVAAFEQVVGRLTDAHGPSAASGAASSGPARPGCTAAPGAGGVGGKEAKKGGEKRGSGKPSVPAVAAGIAAGTGRGSKAGTGDGKEIGAGTPVASPAVSGSSASKIAAPQQKGVRRSLNYGSAAVNSSSNTTTVAVHPSGSNNSTGATAKGQKVAKGIKTPFKTLLLSFDQAWVDFLALFVSWKREDERQLETDLIRAACRLEASMLRKCGTRADHELSHDLLAIKDQVTADHRLLRVRVQRLTGPAGVERMDAALHQVRMEASSTAALASTGSSGSSSGASSSGFCNTGSSGSSSDMSSGSGASAPASPRSSVSSSPSLSPSMSPIRRSSAASGRTKGAPGPEGRFLPTAYLPTFPAPPPLPLPGPSVPIQGSARVASGSPAAPQGADTLATTASTPASAPESAPAAAAAAATAAAAAAAAAAHAAAPAAVPTAVPATVVPATAEISPARPASATLRAAASAGAASRGGHAQSQAAQGSGPQELSPAGVALLHARLYEIHGAGSSAAQDQLSALDMSHEVVLQRTLKRAFWDAVREKLEAASPDAAHHAAATTSPATATAQAPAADAVPATVTAHATVTAPAKVTAPATVTAPDMSQVEALVNEFHDSVKALAPRSVAVAARAEASRSGALRACRTFAQACTCGGTPESSRAALAQILGFVETAGRLLAYLGPEAKERGALEALEKLKGRLGSFATASGGEGEEIGVGGRKGLARALVEGLAALFEQHEVLKREIALAPLHLMPPATALHLLRTSFASAHSLSAYPPPQGTGEVRKKLPRTFQWLSSALKSLDKASTSHQDGSPAPRGPLAAAAVVLRSGRASSAGATGAGAGAGAGLQWEQVGWEVTVAVPVGLVELVRCAEGAELESAPETLRHDLRQLRACQEGFQRIVVVATGLLLVRQALSSSTVRLTASGEAALDRALPRLHAAVAETSVSAAGLGSLLGTVALEAVAAEGTPEAHQGHTKEHFAGLITQLLPKMLDPKGTVFQRATASLSEGLQLLLVPRVDATGALASDTAGVIPDVQRCLKKVGAAPLLPEVVSLAKLVQALAQVTSQLHGPLYRSIVIDAKDSE